MVPQPTQLMQGNEACAAGAIAAGARFFAGYPITPSTEITEELARLMPRVGGKFIQMEDEIASMAAVIGASMAGHKALTTTSGPGFSLMQEMIGYATMTQSPCVIVNVMRAGPSTGLPTEASQGDVMQVRWGTHGEHSIIALCPNSMEECFTLTVDAFNMAERFRTPVIVLSDAVVGHMREGVTLPLAARCASSSGGSQTAPPRSTRVWSRPWTTSCRNWRSGRASRCASRASSTTARAAAPIRGRPQWPRSWGPTCVRLDQQARHKGGCSLNTSDDRLIRLDRFRPAFDKYVTEAPEGSVVYYDSGLVEPMPLTGVELRGGPFTQFAGDEVGKTVVANIVALSAVAAASAFGDPAALREAIRRRVPARFLDLNLQAHELGLTVELKSPAWAELPLGLEASAVRGMASGDDLVIATAGVAARRGDCACLGAVAPDQFGPPLCPMDADLTSPRSRSRATGGIVGP